MARYFSLKAFSSDTDSMINLFNESFGVKVQKNTKLCVCTKPDYIVVVMGMAIDPLGDRGKCVLESMINAVKK